MKLVELVTYFRKDGEFEDFCQSQRLDNNSEVIEIYMEKPYDIDNELKFFEIEKTGGSVQFDIDGNSYFNLFDFYYFLDAIEESKEDSNTSLSDLEIAEKLFHYGVYDA